MYLITINYNKFYCKHFEISIESDKNKKRLSVISEFCLSSSYLERLQPTPAYVDAWNIY